MTRIIAGRARGTRLDVPKSGTRPTSDRVREALFSTLESWNMVQGALVCDLFAGSGALGCEAVSRGAVRADFVERHAPSAQITAKNTKAVSRAWGEAEPLPRMNVHRQSARGFLEAQPDAPLWDVVFVDPPYDFGEADLSDILDQLSRRLRPDGVIMVERSSRSPEPAWPSGLEQFREKRYGETVLWWAERDESSAL